MNAIAWAISGRNDSRDVYGLYGATALWISKGLDDGSHVWQYAPDEGRDEAVRYLTEITEYLEGKDWTLQGDPVEFDLSDEALAQILPDNEGDWIYAPTLREELLAATGRHMSLSGIATTSWSPPSTSWSVKADTANPGDFYVDYAKSHSHATWDEVIG